jgi:hypothetical protein
MNRAASSLLIALASLTLTAAALAQTASPPATHPGISKLQLPQDSPDASLPSATKVTISTMPAMGESCPVSLRAQPGTAPGMVIVGGGKTTASQKLNLRVTNFINRRAITSAQITVHGLTAHGRISPASFRDSEADTVSKQVDLTLTVAPGASASTDMLFKGFTSVRWIDLDSITYADGSMWHSSPQRKCQVVPDRFMLVARQ